MPPKGFGDVTEALLKAGADPNVLDKWYRTPLDLAEQVWQYDHVRAVKAIEVLRQYGAERGAKLKRRIRRGIVGFMARRFACSLLPLPLPYEVLSVMPLRSYPASFLPTASSLAFSHEILQIYSVVIPATSPSATAGPAQSPYKSQCRPKPTPKDIGIAI